MARHATLTGAQRRGYHILSSKILITGGGVAAGGLGGTVYCISGDYYSRLGVKRGIASVPLQCADNMLIALMSG